MTEIDDPIDWESIRARYEAGVEAVKVIARDAGLSPIQLGLRALKAGWKLRGYRKRKSETTAATLRRMKELLQSRLTELETQLKDLSADVSELSSERNIRAANMLVRTLEKVLDLERKDKQRRRAGAQQFRHFTDAERVALAEKLERLQTGDNQGASEAGGAGAEPAVALLGAAGPAAVGGGAVP